MKDELDIKNIVNSIRRSNTLLSVLLTKHQQILCNYQNFSLIYPEVKLNSVAPSCYSINSASINSDLKILNESKLKFSKRI